MFLALRELRFYKLRYGLITSIIMLIGFLVLFMTGLAFGLNRDAGQGIRNARATHYLIEKDAQGRLDRSSISTAQLTDIQGQLSDATPLTIRPGSVSQGKSGTKVDVAFFSVDANTFMRPARVSGQRMRNADTNNVIVSDRLKSKGFAIGDHFTIANSTLRFRIAGFTVNSTYAFSPAIYLNAKQWARVTEGSAMMTTYNVVATRASVANFAVRGVRAVTPGTLLANVPGSREQNLSLGMMIAFMYIISVFVLGVFFYVITLQKLSEFGTLKALGAGTGVLARTLLLEMTVIALIGIVISNLATLAVAVLISNVMPFALTPGIMLGTSAAFVLVAMLSSLVSLRKVTQVDPLIAINGSK